MTDQTARARIFRPEPVSHRVMDWFESADPDDFLTVEDIAVKFGVTTGHANNMMLDLMDQGYIRRELLGQAFAYYRGNRVWIKPQQPKLTSTEERVANLVTDGLTNDQIAGRLSLSTHTVRDHVRSIQRRLGVRSRVASAVKWALMQRGLA